MIIHFPLDINERAFISSILSGRCLTMATRSPDRPSNFKNRIALVAGVALAAALNPMTMTQKPSLPWTPNIKLRGK
jgi:hypothetical protein